MNTIDVYLKIITLLVREIELGEENENDNSKDLIRTVLGLNKNKKANNLMGGESTLVTDLKDLILSINNAADTYTKEMVLNSLKLILKDRKDILDVILQGLTVEMSVAGAKRSIVALRKYLNNYYRGEMISNTVMDAAYKLRSGAVEDKDEFVNTLISNLESLSIETKGKNEGVVDELDIGDNKSMSKVLNTIKDQAVGEIKIKTGWKRLNEMLSGGFRRGEFCIVNALQHKYKSGFTQSLFMQMAMHNKPVLTDKNKKPLILYLSFEDNSDVFVEFMYRYLYYNEFREVPDLNNVSPNEISDYIKTKLSATGYHVKLMRVDPAAWTYKHVFNKVLELEADGYELHGVFIDYLAKLPTTGCINSGPMGTDVRDLFNRMRNFFSA